MSSTPSVAIVILNWNGKKYLEQFLPSVLRTWYPVLEVWVADNASTDDSVTYLEQNFPEVKCLVLEKNWGFADGYNKALAEIRSDYYVLLNSDVAVPQNWLQPIVSFLEKSPNYGAAQPKIKDYNRQEFFEYAGAAGGWIDALGYPFSRGRVLDNCEKDGGQYSTAPIFWASGACFVIRREAFWKAGGFDAAFFAHQEEIDLCWRLQLVGYSIFCCADAEVYHVGGGTLPKTASKKTYLNFRNNLMMLAKNLPLYEAWWKLPLRMGLDQMAGLSQIFSRGPGYLKTIVAAQVHFLGWLFKRPKLAVPKKPLRSLNGVYGGSLLWQVMVNKKKDFNQITDER